VKKLEEKQGRLKNCPKPVIKVNHRGINHLGFHKQGLRNQQVIGSSPIAGSRIGNQNWDEVEGRQWEYPHCLPLRVHLGSSPLPLPGPRGVDGSYRDTDQLCGLEPDRVLESEPDDDPHAYAHESQQDG
jgi:hypothetical protein